MHTRGEKQTRSAEMGKTVSQEMDIVSKGRKNVAWLWRPGSKWASAAGDQSAKPLLGCAVLTGHPIVGLNFGKTFRRTRCLPAREAKCNPAYGDVSNRRSLGTMHIEQGLNRWRFNVCESHVFASTRRIKDLPRVGVRIVLAGTTEQLIGIFDIDRLLA